MAILDEAVKVVRKSPQQYITRYHATTFPNAKKIILGGSIEPVYGETDIRPIFTSVNPWWQDEVDRPVSLRLRIPKPVYRESLRYEWNPDYPHREATGYASKFVQSVDHHGRVDLFLDPIPSEYIDQVCLGDQLDCYDNVYDALDDFRINDEE